MKKAYSSLILLFALLISTHAVAQENQMHAGAGLVYGNEVEKFGVNLNGYYTITSEFRIGATINIFFPESETFGGNDFKSQFTGINFDGNYFFYRENELSAYGLAGINILRGKVEVNNDSKTDSEVGLNLGAGLEYALDFGNLFGELKFAGLGGDADQLVLGAGVRFNLSN